MFNKIIMKKVISYKFNYNIKEYYLFSNLRFFFNLNYNYFIFLYQNRYILFKLPLLFFFKTFLNQTKSLILLNKFLFKSFLAHFFNSYNKFFCFYYFTLKLKGLGYRIFNVSKLLIKIFLNRSNFYYLHIPINVLLKYRTRFFFFLSLDLVVLKSVIKALLYLKEFSIYRLLGIFYKSQLILIKPGKNKYR